MESGNKEFSPETSGICSASLPDVPAAPRYAPALPEADDFVIVNRSRFLDRRGACAIVGPGLDLEGIAFGTVEDAIKRGCEIARRSGVSLWDATTRQAVVLVGAFRR
jgi:hypothetical protein